METQAAPHVGSSPEAPTRAIGGALESSKETGHEKSCRKFFENGAAFFRTTNVQKLSRTYGVTDNDSHGQRHACCSYSPARSTSSVDSRL